MEPGREGYDPPGEKGERLLRTWGLSLLGCLLSLYALFGLATGRILAENRGSWTMLEREDARLYAGLILLVGIVLLAVGLRER